MANKTVVKPLTVRLHPRLYRRAKEVALAREISLNALIQHGLKEAVEQEEYQVRFDAYTLLGQDPEY